ncbi:MAG: AAA family ATPase [Promethearchaeota archaeon]|nr:MAG: AAA family ATPase [Candidatus Lokiarchaeota archaeon]
MKIIIISGTPGCGKTSVSKKISEKIKAEIISLNELTVSENFTLKYDKKRETHVVDLSKLIPYVENLIELYNKGNTEFLIIEGHFSDAIPEKYIDYVIILRCNPDELYKRLEKRGYKIKKIRENIQAEILGNCTNFFIQKQIKSPMYEIDTSNLTIDSIVKIIIDLTVKTINVENFLPGKIDWLEILSQNDRINEFFD